MNPSPQAVAAIRSAVADWTPDDAAIAASLNAPSIPNPDPQGQVPRPCLESTLFPLLSPASAVKVSAHPNFAVIKADIDGGNRAGLIGMWCPVLVGGAYITQPECDAIMAYLQGTDPDPAWPAQISWAQANLGRPVDASDIAASRPGA